ncbi:MAG TPA: DEAD/DEAH box helicase [Dyadobacter sp.]|nr:DEAD/DEAH box helicase [Dyadobacter sp.]
MLYTPYPYQQTAISHILSNPNVQQAGGAGLFLQMGCGKTSVVATACEQLIHQERRFDKMLVIAPKLVAEETWPAEFTKWDHLHRVQVVQVTGNIKQRMKALQTPADVYCIGRDNVRWLVATMLHYNGGRWPFPFVVVDESTSFKNPLSERFKALQIMLPQIQQLIALTGTPSPNGLVDLWAQLYLIDRGVRLGDNYYAFQKEFFTFEQTEEHVPYNHKIKVEKDPIFGKNYHVKRIQSLIGDICISMVARDYLDLPPRMDIFLEAHMPEASLRRYEKFKKDYVTNIAGQEINAFSAPGLYTKLLQFANGAVYDAEVERNYHVEHDTKLDMLEEIVEEAAGDPVLVFYSFDSDVSRIQKKLARFKPKVIAKGDTARWNRGEIPLLLAHPASAGHGLNLQDGGCNIVWFGLPWNLEWYQQACARLDRQGQKRRVNNYHLLCPGTLEFEVARRLKDKSVTQDDLMAALKADVYGFNTTERKWGTAPQQMPGKPGIIGPPAILSQLPTVPLWG